MSEKGAASEKSETGEKSEESETNEKSDNESPPAETAEPPAVEVELKWYQKAWKWFVPFYFANEFAILIILAILLAKAYPPLGAEYLYPEITSKWIAVVFTFLMAGLSLKTSELSKAFQRVYFNAFVHIFNFGVVSAIVFGFSRAMVAIGALAQNLADGMVVCSCLPLTINMVLVLTQTANGDVAAAIFNAAFGNMVGVFLSPVLILGYLGVSGGVNLVEIFYNLALCVILPLFVGQVLQKTSKTVVAFTDKYKKYFKQAQMYALVYIGYTVFCKTFQKDSVSSIGDIFLMIFFQFILLITVMVLAWYSLKLFFPDEPALRVMGLFGCTNKTVALGVPLINAIYANNSNVGFYTLPLLIWHPMQLMVGSALTPYLAAFVDREKERLCIKDDNAETDHELETSERGLGEQEAEKQRTTDEETGDGA